jgi:hypothetical protein
MVKIVNRKLCVAFHAGAAVRLQPYDANVALLVALLDDLRAEGFGKLRQVIENRLALLRIGTDWQAAFRAR